jgi:hypothetical protein
MHLFRPIALRGRAQSCNNHAMTNQPIPLNTNTLDTRDALLMINTLIDCNCYFPNRIYHDDCRHDLRQRDLRDLLIDRTDIDLASDCAELLRDLITRLIDDPYSTQTLSMLCLDNSLCPMHAIDYAICFDDDDPACAAIRTCFPNPDT